MKNFLNSFNNRWSNKILLRIMAIVALVGVVDTIYLTVNYYFGTGVQCLLLEGCEVVLTSQYSEILSIPLAVLGLVFYAGIFVLVNWYDIYQERYLLKWIVAAGTVGFIASLVFLHIQLFMLRALCFYCLTSLTFSTLLFLLATILFNQNKIKI